MTRVSNLQMSRASEYNLNKIRSKTLNTQEQISSLRRLNKLSDDPMAISQVLNLKAKDVRDESVLKANSYVETHLNAAESALAQVSELLSRAKELTIGQSSTGITSPAGRKAIANEVREIRNSILQLTNTRLGARYIFSGFKAESATYNNAGEYKGDDGIVKVEVAPNYFVGMNVIGEDIFTLKNYKSQLYNHLSDQDINERFSPKIAELIRSRDVSLSENQDINVFTVLDVLQDALERDDTPLIQSAIEPIDIAIDQISYWRSEIGARSNSMSVNKDYVEGQRFENKKLLSELEDSDVVQSFSEIEKNENILKVSMMTSEKILTPSLMDFLK